MPFLIEKDARLALLGKHAFGAARGAQDGVLNLVEGRAAIVESPTGAFPPMTVHYAEMFIVPAAVGPYAISPAESAQQPIATIKAYVRRDD